MSPWSPSDAFGHTKKATSAISQRQWSDVANSVLRRGGSDASAIRQANSVIKRRGFGDSSSESAKNPKFDSRPRPRKSSSSGRSTSHYQPEEDLVKTKRRKAVKSESTRRMFKTRMEQGSGLRLRKR